MENTYTSKNIQRYHGCVYAKRYIYDVSKELTCPDAPTVLVLGEEGLKGLSDEQLVEYFACAMTIWYRKPLNLLSGIYRGDPDYFFGLLNCTHPIVDVIGKIITGKDRDTFKDGLEHVFCNFKTSKHFEHYVTMLSHHVRNASVHRATTRDGIRIDHNQKMKPVLYPSTECPEEIDKIAKIENKSEYKKALSKNYCIILSYTYTEKTLETLDKIIEQLWKEGRSCEFWENFCRFMTSPEDGNSPETNSE